MKKKNLYFGEREERAVVDYNNATTFEEKNRIYNEILIEPFRKMVQSILHRYPIYIGNYSIEEVEENALTHLIEHMIKFDPNNITKSGNKTKAFSYCQTIVRNYFKDHTRKTYNDQKINVSYDDYVEEIKSNNEYIHEMGDDDDYYILDRLINNVVDKIEDKIENSTIMKKNEIVVGEAIIDILRNWHSLFQEETPEGNVNGKVTNKFAKNKILFYMKEITGLTTKEIRLGIKPFKDIYYNEKGTFFDF